MREFYKTKHFDIRELVDKATYNKFGELAFMFFDTTLLKVIDAIREYLNVPITINNWHVGGPYDSRGLRTPTDTTGATYSQHRYGRALDFSAKGYTAEQIRKIIKDHENEYPFSEITAMEKDVSWVHIDFRNIAFNGIYLFNG